MISASALAPNCGYARILNAKREKPASTIEAAARGTTFHAAVETWLHTGVMPTVDDLEIQGWLDLLASQWEPPMAAECELSWGLRPDGSYTDVNEPEPHKYVAVDGGALLTAGRADVAFDRRGSLVVIDWKTGKWPVTAAAGNLQVNAAGLALAQRAGAVSYQPVIYYVRDGAWDHGDEVYGREFELMLAEVRTAATLPPEPRPGPWCARCWERKDCPQAAT